MTPFGPTIVKELPSVTISQDKEMMKFEVKVIGHPKPNVKWLKQGEEITQSEEFQIENLEDGTSILIINDVYPDDTGEIKFEAYNAVGVAQTITNFEVVEGERISKFVEFKNKQISGFFKQLKICSNFNLIPIPLVLHT